MRGDDRVQADALDRVWDALAGRPGEPVQPSELDPHDAAVPAVLAELERAATIHSAPPPRWAAVYDRIQAPSATAPRPPAGWGRPFAGVGRPPVWPSGRSRWSPASKLGIGAAAVVALLVVAFGSNGGRFWGGPEPTRRAPALAAVELSPTATPLPTAVPAGDLRAFDVNSDGIMTVGELWVAVAAVIPQYAWPPGYQVSTELIMGPSRVGGYEPGFEWTVVGGVYHRCAWELAWIDARATGDQELQAAALEQLTDVVPMSPTASPDTIAWTMEIASRAAAGDPSIVVQDVANNCKVAFLTPEGALPATPEPGDGSPAAPVELSAPGISWSPNELTVPQGGVIRLTNDGTGGPHNFIVQGYNDHAPVDMPPGSQTDITVPADLPPGTYTFYCSIPGHRALMEGSITILATD